MRGPCAAGKNEEAARLVEANLSHIERQFGGAQSLELAEERLKLAGLLPRSECFPLQKDAHRSRWQGRAEEGGVEGGCGAGFTHPLRGRHWAPFVMSGSVWRETDAGINN